MEHVEQTVCEFGKSAKIGIIGNGSWGTAIAKILTDNGRSIHWWIRNKEALAQLKKRQHNPHYLTSVRFVANTIHPTNDLPAMMRECDIVIVAIPSAFAQDIIRTIEKSELSGKIIISAIKGILPECNLLLNDYLNEFYDFSSDRYVAITGPCHAEEVAEERLSYLTFSGLNDRLTACVAKLFDNAYIHTTTNHDLWGVQFAAVLKNIYAIGSGIARALDYGDNFQSVYITNCYREMYQFLVRHFKEVNPSVNMPDFHTSAYLGDLLVTCYSLHSRNRTFGTMIGKGYTVKAAQLEMSMIAEGYYGASGIHNISNKYNLELPIAGAIYKILWEHLLPQEAFSLLEKILS